MNEDMNENNEDNANINNNTFGSNFNANVNAKHDQKLNAQQTNNKSISFKTNSKSAIDATERHQQKFNLKPFDQIAQQTHPK